MLSVCLNNILFPGLTVNDYYTGISLFGIAQPKGKINVANTFLNLCKTQKRCSFTIGQYIVCRFYFFFTKIQASSVSRWWLKSTQLFSTYCLCWNQCKGISKWCHIWWPHLVSPALRLLQLEGQKQREGHKIKIKRLSTTLLSFLLTQHPWKILSDLPLFPLFFRSGFLLGVTKPTPVKRKEHPGSILRESTSGYFPTWDAFNK